MKKNLVLSLCILLAAGIGCHAQETGAGCCRIGDYSLYVLTENNGTGNTGLFTDIPADVLEKHAPDGTFPNALHAFLLRKGDEIWLFDTGFGRNTFARMDSLGISPDEVDYIFLTHMHTDHIAGMLREGEPAFPNARVRVSEKEYHYWNSREEMMKMPEERRSNFLLAQEVSAKYGDRIVTENPLRIGSDFGDGIHMLEAYGHSPGHIVYLIQDGSERFLIWGDLTHAVTIQTEHPELSIAFDHDPGRSRESREKVLEYVSAHGIPVAGMHVPFGGVGSIKKNDEGGGYTFTPAASR